MKLQRSNGLQGTVYIPGDKSISHRAVMFGSIANGQTTVTNFLLGEDCLSTIDCFQKLGVEIVRDGDKVTVNGKGYEGLQEPTRILDVGNSGTTMRLILGILAGVEHHCTLIGDDSIGKRPMSRVTEPLKKMGASIDGRENGKYTPISIRGGNLTGITYTSPVASAQVKSAILLAGLRATGETIVREPSKSRDHTERMLRQFGVEVMEDGCTVSLKGNQQLMGTAITVPGDISSAAFFLVAGTIIPNSDLLIKNVGLNETRAGIIEVLMKMGANLTIKDERNADFEPAGDIEVKSAALKGIEVGGEIIPRLIDEIPIIALAATQASGKTIIKDAQELKVKETNRIQTVVDELTKMGAKIEATEDGMIVHGPTPLHGAVVNSHGDHRIGMMLAVAALLATGETVIENAEAVSVSFPNFFEILQQL
ncbi:MAG: 3-phosphoshikimate 1-carboxyvinyltransferase [Bacillaceae bacterium]